MRVRLVQNNLMAQEMNIILNVYQLKMVENYNSGMEGFGDTHFIFY